MTPTHSGVRAKGTIFGLEGKTVVPVLGATVVSVVLMVMLVMTASGGLVPRIAGSMVPFLLTLVYVVLLVHRRPPHYARDVIEGIRGRIPLIGNRLSPYGVSLNVSPGRKAGVRPLKALQGRASF